MSGLTTFEPSGEPSGEPTLSGERVSDRRSRVRSKPTIGPEAFEAAWKAYPHVEGRSSKPNALAEWRKLDPDAQAGLLDAIGRFRPKVAQAHGDRGAPDMARWLRDGKHLGWLEIVTATEVARPAFEGPPDLMASVALAAGDDFARKWITPCRWRASDRTLIARTTFAAKTITGTLKSWMADKNVRVEVEGDHQVHQRKAA